LILPPREEGPRPPFALEALARLPLAEAFYRLWAHFATDATLDSLFEAHRGRCYHDTLSFAELVGALTDAITRYHGSGNRALGEALKRQQLSTLPRAAYGKLGRLPLPLAEAFLSALTARLRLLFPAGVSRTALPGSLAGLAVVVLDGKKIKKVAKRLLATRGRPGKLFGGKVLAAYLPQCGLVVALAADADGEANDVRLLPRAVPLARAAVAGPRLWVADAQFCDLDQPGLFARDGDHFLLRFTLRNGFTADPSRPEQAGQTASGQAYAQQWGWMGSEKDRRRRYVRRVALHRPGEEAVILVTDLLDEGAYPAADLLAVYLARWQIENVFQQITEVFELRHLIGCTPQATVFQAALCLVVYNVLQVIRAYAAVAAPEAGRPEQVSVEKVYADLHEELVSLHRTVKEGELLEVLHEGLTAPQLQARLATLLAVAWQPSWIKAAPRKRPKQAPRARQSGAHTSVHKLLQQAKRQKGILAPRRRN
jgi:Transposase DDE domain